MEKQIRAINLAIRDAKHDLVKAQQDNNQEWIDEQNEIISGLESAKKSIGALLAIREALK